MPTRYRRKNTPKEKGQSEFQPQNFAHQLLIPLLGRRNAAITILVLLIVWQGCEFAFGRKDSADSTSVNTAMLDNTERLASATEKQLELESSVRSAEEERRKRRAEVKRNEGVALTAPSDIHKYAPWTPPTFSFTDEPNKLKEAAAAINEGNLINPGGLSGTNAEAVVARAQAQRADADGKEGTANAIRKDLEEKILREIELYLTNEFGFSGSSVPLSRIQIELILDAGVPDLNELTLCYSRLGEVRNELKEYSLAVDSFELARDLGHKNYILEYNLAQAYTELRNKPKAFEAIERARSMQPDSFVIRLAKMLIVSDFRDAAEWSECLEPLRAEVESKESLTPYLKFIHASAGGLLALQGNYKDSLAELEMARDLGLSDSELDRYFAEAYLGLGRISEALTAIESAILQEPIDADYRELKQSILLKGSIYLDQFLFGLGNRPGLVKR